MMLKVLISLTLLAIAQGKVCEAGKGGKDCVCDVSTAGNEQPKAPTLLKEDITLEDGVLTVVIVEDPAYILQPDLMPGLFMTIKDPEDSGFFDEDGLKTCLALFDWTLVENGCTDRSFTGTILLTDLGNDCPYTTTETSGDDAYFDATWHLGVSSSRTIIVDGEELEQTLSSLLPVKIQFPKTVKISSENITVQEAQYPTLSLTFGVPCDLELTPDGLAGTLADFILPSVPADELVVIIDQSGTDCTVKVTMVPDEDTTKELVDAILDSPNFPAAFGCPVDDTDCPVVPAESVEGFNAITFSGVVETTLDYVDENLVPTAKIGLYTKNTDRFKLVNGVHLSMNSKLQYDVWALASSENCEADGEMCKSTFETNIRDISSVCTFTGAYAVEFDVVCSSGNDCAVNGRGLKASMTFNINSGDHCPRLVDGVKLGGQIVSYVKNPLVVGVANAQPSVAYLNDEAIFFVGQVRSGQASLDEAVITDLVLVGDLSEVSLYTNKLITASGSAVELELSDSTDDVTDPASETSYLQPRFNLMTRMGIFDFVSSEGIYSLRATVAVKYNGVGASRRLLTTTYGFSGRSLLAGNSASIDSEEVSVGFKSDDTALTGSAVAALPAALQFIALACLAVVFA